MFQFVAHQPDLAGHRVVADEQRAIAHDAAAEPGAERHAEQVAITFGAARRFEQPVDIRQESGRCLAVSEQVAIIVDERRQCELIFQHRVLAPRRDKPADCPGSR